MTNKELANIETLIEELQHELVIWQESIDLIKDALQNNDKHALLTEAKILGKIDDSTLQGIRFDLCLAVFKSLKDIEA